MFYHFRTILKVYLYIIIDGNTPNDLKKQKIFHFTDKLLLHNMAASSGLRENVYPINFLLKMFIPVNNNISYWLLTYMPINNNNNIL